MPIEPRLPPAPHDENGFARLELGDMEQQVPSGRDVPRDNRRMVEVEPVGQRDGRTGRDADQLGKAARPLDAHHALGPFVVGVIFAAEFERHHAGGRDPHAGVPIAHARADGVDDARAVDARNERQRRSARALAAGAHTDVEHAVDGGGVHPDPDLAFLRRRVRDVLVFQNIGRAELMDNDRLHTAPLCASGG